MLAHQRVRTWAMFTCFAINGGVVSQRSVDDFSCYLRDTLVQKNVISEVTDGLFVSFHHASHFLF